MLSDDSGSECSTFELTDEVIPGGGGTNVFVFGTPGANEFPIAGDWDGDGDETIGVYDPSLHRFRLRNSNSAGPADHDFTLVLPFDLLGYQPVAGDWNGDGIDSVGVWLPPDTLFLAGVRLAAAGLAFGVPTGLVYHLELRRALLQAERLPARWWLRPTGLHRDIPPALRTRVLAWCYAGAAGFVLSMLGCALVAVGALRML